MKIVRRWMSKLGIALALCFSVAGCGDQTNDGYIPASSNIWSGVKLYFGDKRAYVFEVVGGDENHRTSSGTIRGVKVRYPNGSEEWKDRSYITGGNKYFVKADDPALTAQRWQILSD